jgi:pilus assembly protein Flp/PilA
MCNETNHALLHELLPQYAANTLDEIVRQHVAAHLAECASCQADLAEWHLIIEDLRHELADLPPDVTPEQSWSVLHARLSPRPSVLDQMRNSTSTTMQSFLDKPVRLQPAAGTRSPAYQRWLGFASVVAVVLIIVRTSGQGMLEYALIIALVAVVVIASLVLLGPQIAKILQDVTNNL